MPYESALGWEGEKVRLVPLNKEKHFANAVAWLNDPEVTTFTLTGDFPITRIAEEAWFEKMSQPGDTDVFFAIETHGGEHVGFSGLHRIDYRNGVATTGTLIGRKDTWGRGLGTDACKVRAQYAFQVLGLRLLLSNVFADNTGSARMLTKAGYKEVGRIPRRYWKRGSYRDDLILALYREDWLAETGNANQPPFAA